MTHPLPPDIQLQIKNLSTNVTAFQNQVAQHQAEVTRKLEALHDNVKGAIARVEGMLERIGKVETGLATLATRPPGDLPPTVRPKITFDDFTTQLHTSIEKVNKKLQESASQFVLDGLEVELKAGVDVSDKVTLTPPLAQELKPEAVSAFRFKLRPITRMKLADS